MTLTDETQNVYTKTKICDTKTKQKQITTD